MGLCKTHLVAQCKKGPKAIKIGPPIKLQVTSNSQLLHEALSPVMFWVKSFSNKMNVCNPCHSQASLCSHQIGAIIGKSNSNQ